MPEIWYVNGASETVEVLNLSITKGLSRALAELSRKLSWKETAGHFGVDWKTVASTVKRAVGWGLKHRPWKPLHWIGIDEVSRSKGQRYLTLVYDLERGRLVWIGENRDAARMEAFFRWLGPRRRRSIKVVCCDMWSIYIEAVRKTLPDAVLLFDRFHVVAHLNRAVDEFAERPGGSCPKRRKGAPSGCVATR